MKKSFGTIELIKDGLIEEQEIILEDENIEDEIKKIKEDLQDKAIEGYHSIIKHPYILKNGIGFDYTQTTIYVSNVLCENDYLVILNEVKDKIKNQQKDLVYIYNYVNKNNHLDYNLYQQQKYPIHNGLSEETKKLHEKMNEANGPINILDLFLRKKLKKLSNDELEMFEKYEEFNLEDILFSDKNRKFPLNNGDAGLITIFEDRKYETPVTKLQHYREREEHVKWYRDETLDQRDDPNYISIHLYYHGIAGFIPENLNEYQIQKMNKFIENVKELQEKNREIDFNFATVSESGTMLITQSFDSIAKVEQYMKETYHNIKK